MNADTKEADIVISGQKLTTAQSMTVRVAIQAFIAELNENNLGNDEMGRRLTEGYLARCREINELLARTAR